MKDNVFRIIYGIICFIVLYLSYSYYDDVVSSTEVFETFSYVGTVFTTIGLIVAIFEVLHSVYVSKTIQQQTQELLERVKDVENASNISDCISAVDETNRHVMNENYAASLCCFQSLRKLFVKLNIDSFQDDEKLNEVEKIMFKSTRTTAKAPLSKPQKDQLISDILNIKVALEKSNPANGSR
tara:strand:+ start:808 stop:1356 length:549 start_codon:yes stop_codon:yes gene_type:complete